MGIGVVFGKGKPADTAPNRQRSAEQIGDRVAKRPKTGGHKYPSFSDIVKSGGEVLAIIGKGGEEGTIPKEKWRWVEEVIADIYLQIQEDNPGPPPYAMIPAGTRAEQSSSPVRTIGQLSCTGWP